VTSQPLSYHTMSIYIEVKEREKRFLVYLAITANYAVGTMTLLSTKYLRYYHSFQIYVTDHIFYFYIFRL